MEDFRESASGKKITMTVFSGRTAGASVYNFRPLQCRTYPFWRPYLESEDDWNALAMSCPGVNRGKIHPCSEIEEKLSQRLAEPLIDDFDSAFKNN